MIAVSSADATVFDRASGILDPERHRLLFTTVAAVVVAAVTLRITAMLPYYPTSWRYLLVAAIALVWVLRPGVAEALALAFFILPVAYSLNIGQYGIWLAGGAALIGLILLDPFAFLVVGVAVSMLTVPSLSGLVVVAPVALAATKPPRAALAAALACAVLVLLSVAAGRPLAPGVLDVPALPALASAALAPVGSLLDFSWTGLTGQQEADAFNALVAGVLKPFADNPILLGQIGLWALAAAVASSLAKRSPWDNLLARWGEAWLRALRTVSAVIVGALLLGLGEFALKSSLTAEQVDGLGIALPCVAAGLIVIALWPLLGNMPEALSEKPGPGLLMDTIPGAVASRSGTPFPEKGSTPEGGTRSAYRRGIPTDSWGELAGVSDIQAEIQDAIASQFNPEVGKTLRSMALRPTRGILLFGPPGTGKTKIARVIAAQARASFFAVSGSEFSSKYFGESEANLRKIFDDARQARPSVVFFDELEAFLPKRIDVSRADAPEKSIVGTFLGLTDGVASLDGILLVGATNYPNQIDEAALRPGRFDKLIYVSPPDRAARRLIFERYLAGRPLAPDVDVDTLAAKTDRYTGADIQAVCAEAARKAMRRGGAPKESSITEADLEGAIGGAKPTVTFEMVRRFQAIADQYGRRSEKAVPVHVVARPTLGWDDVAGLDDVKEALRESIELPLQHPDLYKEYGVAPPKGILLFGPPGCGKTFLARVVASAAGAHFLDVKGPELLRSPVGASEAQLRTLFDRARENAPCVLFFDEIDAFASARGGSDHTNTQMLTQLLTEMDGVDELHGVVVVAATNRPAALDPALMRPGRFDRAVYVPPPDAAARDALFRHELAGKPLDTDIDFGELSRLTEGRSGADITGICSAAAIGAAKDSVARNEKQLVGMERLVAQVARTKPSLSAGQLAEFNALRAQFER